MSPGKRQDPLPVLTGRRTTDLLPGGARPGEERERRKAVHTTNPDRRAGRRQVKECALARFGLEAGKMVRQTLIRRVQKGDVKYARKLTNTRTVIVLDYADGEMAFLYSSATKDIVSFLAPDAPETADWRRSRAAALVLFNGGSEEICE
jgi:hypothetical protein